MNKGSVFYTEYLIKKVFYTGLAWLIIAMIAAYGIVQFGNFADSGSVFTWIGVGFGVSGWLIMARAKWPQIRRGDLVSFGVKGLPVENRRLYLMSYCFLVLGLATIASSHWTL